jgi:hypothetical protein
MAGITGACVVEDLARARLNADLNDGRDVGKYAAGPHAQSTAPRAGD